MELELCQLQEQLEETPERKLRKYFLVLYTPKDMEGVIFALQKE